MSYEKQNWKNGDVITETKLNHMEDGIATGGGGVLVVGVTAEGSTGTLTNTWQEIYDAKMAILDMPSADTKMLFLCTQVRKVSNEDYDVKFRAMEDPENVAIIFNATSADGYPSATMG